MAPRFSDFVEIYGSAAQANYLIHVSLADRYVYFVNPKVACSTIKATLNTREAARTGRPLEIASMDEVHDRAHNPLLSPREVGRQRFERMLTDPAVTRFSFVRDPLKRFCSAYLNKIGPKHQTSEQYAALLRHMGLPAGHDLTLEEFAHACAEDENIRDLDPHWRLQRRQIAWGLVDYSFVGRHEHFAEDFATLSRTIFGGREVPVFDTRTRFGQFTNAPKLSEAVPDAVRALIARAYEADYEMLAEIGRHGLWQPREAPRPAGGGLGRWLRRR